MKTSELDIGKLFFRRDREPEIMEELRFRVDPEPKFIGELRFRVNPRPEIIEEFCFGCFNCAIVCPRGVLIIPEAGMVPLIKTPHECTGCRRCIDACPHDAIRISETIFNSF